jgi:trehalose 6-phosphate synthase/phosphatase
MESAMTREKVKATVWGLIATIGLALLILLGSRRLVDFDAALVGYTFATLFATFGITYRYSIWLQRPPTAMFWKRGWQLFFAPGYLLTNLRRLVYRLGVMFALNRFIWRRSAERGAAHFLIMWGCIIAVAITFPDELVGNINGKFGTPAWTPVIYQYRSFPQEQLLPMYAASDVMLVTPLRDGMNLVAKEYVASRADATGVLILSEMTGATSELGEALTVNPNDIPGMARAIAVALEMPADAQKQSMQAMRERCRRYDVVRWAGDFLDSLREQHSELEQRILSAAMRERLVQDFRSASRRLVLCDYDGTLVPLRLRPEQARPSSELLATLDRLAAVSEVVIVSGRPRATMEPWFGQLPLSLVAEHGAWIRERGRDWNAAHSGAADWQPKVRNLMELYVDRLPGAFVEEKEFTVAWHYRQADPDLGSLRAKELTAHLLSLIEKSDLKVVEGSKVIEVRPSGFGKGKACVGFLAQGFDFVLALGDDTTDEDLFRALPETAWSIRVGLGRTHARFNLYNQGQARHLLETLAAALSAGSS